MLPNHLAQRLWDYMQEHGLTQASAREWANVSPSTMNKLLKGGSVRAQTILQIAKATKIDEVVLLKDAGYVSEDKAVISGQLFPVENPIKAMHLMKEYFEVIAQLPVNTLNTPEMKEEIDAVQAAYQLVINKMKDS